ncbi:MAG: Undecaprenyl-phosphate N-acetylglucosaminyl 1-phosphate transferase (EC [uncultured Thiotrichaceae bacterium]|uniref:Undecaprenyl-phosphate N-acetylglucosaminyl 1-phosphate transferase (EC) n=1 Tax=uncultured Thiotrichaceae bacterium TaxID=298394 RepID=A0A6S6UHR0_9GAMM|nr:MAG: Undecaprenyl-phosphate N-acetylglucosaminyl 1-phosphate transferase (EC [uncultured Thiotrichaceae bacterium]
MLLTLTITVLLTSISVLFIINKASSIGLIAVPNHRSSHLKVTPCGAGIGFVFAFLIGILSIGHSFYGEYILSLVAITLVFFLGVYDDYNHSSSRTKFFVILLASILIFLNGLKITSVGSYYGNPIEVSYLALPLTVFAVVGFTNALNLLDGIDGLAALTSIIILAGLGMVGYQYDNPLVYKLSGVLIAALGTFLLFNWNPAKIFMGDSGSLTLGFVIAVLSIEVTKYVDPVSILFITAIPILDTVTVMVRRKLEGVSILTADRNHVHHIVQRYLGGSVRQSVILLASIQLCFTIFGVFVAPQYSQENTLPLFFFCLLIFYWGTEKMRAEYAKREANSSEK